MVKPADHAKIVAQAEKAVAAVKDPELRRAAFEKVLEHLLSVQDQPPKPTPRTTPANRGRERTERKPLRRRTGPKANIEELVADGFFNKPKTIAQVRAELGNRGHHIPLTALSGPLQRLCQDRVLRRQKTKVEGKKQTYNYTKR